MSVASCMYTRCMRLVKCELQSKEYVCKSVYLSRVKSIYNLSHAGGVRKIVTHSTVVRFYRNLRWDLVCMCIKTFWGNWFLPTKLMSVVEKNGTLSANFFKPRHLCSYAKFVCLSVLTLCSLSLTEERSFELQRYLVVPYTIWWWVT